MFKYSIWIHLFIEELYFQTSCCVSLPPGRHIQHLRNQMCDKYSFSHNFPQACTCYIPKPTPTPTPPPPQAKEPTKVGAVGLGRQSQHRETGRHSVRLCHVSPLCCESLEKRLHELSPEKASGKWYPGLPRRAGASRSLLSVFVWSRSKRSGRTGEVERLWVGIVGPYVLNHSVISDSLRPHGLQPTRLLCPWDSPGKCTGVAYHFLLQGIFPTRGSNPCLLHLLHRKCILYHWATWKAR